MLLCAFLRSLPLRECGLKYISRSQLQFFHLVTPLAGVWIEIFKGTGQIWKDNVTPLAGVWIEITMLRQS